MIKHLVLSLSFIVSLYSSVNSQTGWFWQNPLPQGNNLSKASYINESIVYVSGAGGTLMKSTNGGVNFSIINTGLTDNLAVDFINEMTGFSASGGGILRTLDGGLSWQYYTIDTDYNIRQFFNINNILYLVAHKFITSQPPLSRIYKSIDLGQTWNANFNPHENTYVNSLHFINQQTGYAVGRRIGGPGFKPKIYKTSNAGSTWDSISSNLTYELFTSCFINQNTGYITGRNSAGRNLVLKTTNGCAGFDTAYSQSSSQYTGIKFFNQTEGYAYTSFTYIVTTNSGLNWTFYQEGNAFLVNKDNGILLRDNFIYRTTNSGSSWINFTQGFSKDHFWDIYFLNENTGFIGGQSKIFKTTNSGLTWNSDTLAISNSPGVEAVQFVNNSTGYASLDMGWMAKTTNTGESWTISRNPNGDHNHGMSFPSADTGYIVTKGGITFKTTNGSANWVNAGGEYSSYYDVYFVNNTTGFLCGGSYTNGKGIIKKTTNGGGDWQVFYTDSSGNFYDACVSNSNIWYVAGQIHSSYGGMICRSVDMGVTWQITYFPERIHAIHFPSQNTGYASADNKMYKTTDGGNIWLPTYSISSSAPWGIYFISENTGWAVGTYGKVIKTTTGGGGLIGINPVSTEIPRAFSLKQNYPNPFNPTTNIEFRIADFGLVNLTIYDLLGREIESMVNESLSPGVYKVSWNASHLPSGVYFYRLKTADFTESRKMILIK